MLDFRDLASTGQVRRSVRLLAKAMPLAAMLAMSGCSGQLPGTAMLNAFKAPAAQSAGAKSAAPSSSPAKASSANGAETAASAADWGSKYSADPKNKLNAINYADMLASNGRTDQAVAVLQKAAINFPDDQEILAAYGKALAADGRFEQALPIIRRAQTPDRPDWRLLSAEAAILDQIGQNAAARKLYRQALDFSPDSPMILSNLGLSYLMTNELPQAEKYLRLASTQPRADSRIRQNLALAVGLQGRFAEAEKIVGKELPPEQAKANVAVLRAMLSQSDNWQKLKTAGFEPGVNGQAAPAAEAKGFASVVLGSLD